MATLSPTLIGKHELREGGGECLGQGVNDKMLGSSADASVSNFVSH